MKIKIKELWEIILAGLAIILIVIVFLRPPTDFDGGPMMAYNLLFFLPMVLLAGLLSLISAIIAISKLIRKKSNNKVIKIISLFLSIPILNYSLLVFLPFILPSDYDYPMPELIPDPKYNSCDSVNLKNDQTVHLIGYNWGRHLEKRRLYLSLTPYQCDTFTIVETYCCQGNSLMDIYFKNLSDSVFVYVPLDCNVYTHHGQKYLNKLPVKTIKIDSYKMDSLIANDKKKKIRKYEWNK
jgi:hypothetical protein